MKVEMNGMNIECTVEEFRQITNTTTPKTKHTRRKTTKRKTTRRHISPRWTTEEDTTIMELRREGQSHRQIARNVRRSPAAIAVRLCTL